MVPRKPPLEPVGGYRRWLLDNQKSDESAVKRAMYQVPRRGMLLAGIQLRAN
jgi:hypothetical protein